MKNELIQLSNQIAKRYHNASALDDLRWKQEKQHFLSIVQSSKDLLECTPESLQDAALQGASMGLSFNRIKQHCYIIPRRARKKEKSESWDSYNKNVPMIAYASPGYRGLSHIAVATGLIQFMRAQEVYLKDHFKYKGPIDLPDYVANPEALKQSEKYRQHDNAYCVYAVAKDKYGNAYCELIDKSTILKIRNRSENPNGLMWNPSGLWTEGWKKAAIRRLYKTLPALDNSRIDAAIQVMDQHEGIITDITEETTQFINNDQYMELFSRLDELEFDSDQKKKWLNKLAFAISGIDDIHELPVDKFDQAMEKLNEVIKEYKAKHD